MIRYFCQKCNEEVDNELDLNNILRDGGTMTEKELGGICDDCYEKLKKWLKLK